MTCTSDTKCARARSLSFLTFHLSASFRYLKLNQKQPKMGLFSKTNFVIHHRKPYAKRNNADLANSDSSAEMSNDGDNVPACDTISHHVVPTERVGAVNVWVQGDLSLAQKAESRDSTCCFMTVHDVGVNHNTWLRFANSPAMAQIREKAVFLHIDLLGQEDGADDVDGSYPSMQEIGEDLVNILDTLRVKCVIGLGEGAGANILLRFGAMHVSRCLGIVCLNPNPTTPTLLANIMVISLRIFIFCVNSSCFHVLLSESRQLLTTTHFYSDAAVCV